MGTHLTHKHITQNIPYTQEHTRAPFHTPPTPSWTKVRRVSRESPANLWDLLSQQNGKPQADKCGLRGPTPCMGSALPPASSKPQSPISPENTSIPFKFQLYIYK